MWKGQVTDYFLLLVISYSKNMIQLEVNKLKETLFSCSTHRGHVVGVSTRFQQQFHTPQAFPLASKCQNCFSILLLVKASYVSTSSDSKIQAS